jgi:hypothetical protein
VDNFLKKHLDYLKCHYIFVETKNKRQMKKHSNPIVDEVVDKFNTVYDMVKLFSENRYSAVKGLLISGDAGTGKTHWVQKAFIDTKSTEDVKYVKGSSISAAALYVILYAYRESGKVIVLDDCDIIHKSPAERNSILDMLKGATEITKGERNISWERAAPNPLMVANNVPTSFNFEGSIVWITNETTEDISKKVKNHWNAIFSRFTIIKVYLNQQEKLLYTLHLIEDIGMLGLNCQGKEGGYPLIVQSDTIEYIKENYKLLPEITPRMAIRIADTRFNFPTDWKKYVNNSI